MLLWTLKYARRTTLVLDRILTRHDTCHSRVAGSIGTIRTKARVPRFVHQGVEDFGRSYSHVHVGSKWRQVGRRGRDSISSESGGYVRRGLEAGTVEPRWDQDHHNRGTSASRLSFR